MIFTYILFKEYNKYLFKYMTAHKREVYIKI
jgi:hypothetical protein